MPMCYSKDILTMLKSMGFSTYRIRKEKLLSESTVQKLRNGKPISWENIEMLCKMLRCQPGDILEYIEDKK